MATGDEWLSVVAEAKAPMYEHVFIMTILEGESTQWKPYSSPPHQLIVWFVKRQASW